MGRAPSNKLSMQRLGGVTQSVLVGALGKDVVKSKIGCSLGRELWRCTVLKTHGYLSPTITELTIATTSPLQSPHLSSIAISRDRVEQAIRGGDR